MFWNPLSQVGKFQFTPQQQPAWSDAGRVKWLKSVQMWHAMHQSTNRCPISHSLWQKLSLMVVPPDEIGTCRNLHLLRTSDANSHLILNCALFDWLASRVRTTGHKQLHEWCLEPHKPIENWWKLLEPPCVQCGYRSSLHFQCTKHVYFCTLYSKFSRGFTNLSTIWGMAPGNLVWGAKVAKPGTSTPKQLLLLNIIS